MNRADDKVAPRVAVALRYEAGRDGVPVVVAKGEGPLAERIVALAEVSGVRVEEDEALARALSQVEIDKRIPPEFFKAVAVIIGFVMRQRGAPPQASHR